MNTIVSTSSCAALTVVRSVWPFESHPISWFVQDAELILSVDLEGSCTVILISVRGDRYEWRPQVSIIKNFFTVVAVNMILTE